MLRAIIYGIDQFLQCPSIEGRERIWSRYGGLFQNCVAVMDASEHPIRIVKSKELEISTYPDYYYLHLNVKKLAIPMKMSSFFWSSSNVIISLFNYCWYFCCCHCIFNISWHCIDFGIRCILDRPFLLSRFQIVDSIFTHNVKTCIYRLKKVETLSGIVQCLRNGFISFSVDFSTDLSTENSMDKSM